MSGQALTSRANESLVPSSVMLELARAAIRRGLVASPFGLALGWLMGRSADADQAATVFALVLGLGLVPAFAAAIHVGRLASGRLGLGVPAATVAGVVSAGAWGLLGGLLIYAFSLVTTLEVRAQGMITLLAVTGLVAGVLGAMLGIGLGHRAAR